MYTDDIHVLVSGNNAQEHLGNLRALFRHLNQKGLCCNLKKCIFAQPSAKYLGQALSKDGVAQESKVDTVLRMPSSKDIRTLRSFTCSVQFYTKFLPPYLSTTTEPLQMLTSKGQQWKWGKEKQKAVERLKDLLCTDKLLHVLAVNWYPQLFPKIHPLQWIIIECGNSYFWYSNSFPNWFGRCLLRIGKEFVNL